MDDQGSSDFRTVGLKLVDGDGFGVDGLMLGRPDGAAVVGRADGSLVVA